MHKLTCTLNEIRQLAAHEQPGALAVAEQAVDRHVALFSAAGDRLTALDALSRDLLRFEQDRPELSGFLRRVQSYISHVWSSTHAD